MAIVLVTGGCGFIGSHLVEALVERGHQVIVVDNLSTGSLENIAHILNKVEFYEHDIRNLAAMERIMRGVDYVYHEAAVSSVMESIADAVRTNEANVSGTVNVLHASREAGVKRVIYASSSAIYGNTATVPIIEATHPDTISPYAASKIAGEMYMHAFYHSYGLETISLRYFNVYGPRQESDSEYAAVIPRFIQTMLKGDLPIIYGDGKQSRDFVYVEDVVTANLLAMDTRNTYGQALNIGSGHSTSIGELFCCLQEIVGVEGGPVFRKMRTGDVKHSWADIHSASRDLGYSPSISFEEGLRLTLDWYRQSEGS